jgi:hypothetical protein
VFIGSDAQKYTPPAYFGRATQIPALKTFLVCDDAFAGEAYEFGLRWLPLNPDFSTPQSDLQFALEHLGLHGAYWLRDVWAGRELHPDYATPEIRRAAGSDNWHSRLRPRADGTPPFGAFLALEPSYTLREVERIRREVSADAPERRPYLTSELPVFRPRTLDELDRDLKAIADAVARRPGAPARLWLRGQTRQYDLPRDPGGRVGQWLGLVAAAREPSLIPSIGRPGLGSMPDDINKAQRWASGSDFVWRAPLISWLAEQPGYAPADPDARRLLDELTDDVPANIGEVLGMIPFHPELDALDDLRQWWIMGAGRSGFMPLPMQHYGARTTVLDLTYDVRAALYFARRRWSATDSAFVDAIGGDPCIFVFAQRLEGSGDEFIVDSESVMRTAIHVDVPLRIAQQACGLLTGANARATNRALDLAVAVVDLTAYSFGAVPHDEDMYPPPDKDSLFARLLRTRPEPPGLMRFGH